MAGGYTVGIASETRAFEKGVESGIIEPLEEAQDTLQDLARDRSLDKLEDSMEDARKETERLERQTKDTADAIEREYASSYRAAKRSSDDGLDAMSDKSREVGSELKQNIGETFSSFRGDLEDLPQIAQDTLGGLAGSGALGGIPGLVATAFGAAAIGSFIGWLDNANAKSEETKQVLSENFREMAENGIAAWESLAAQQQRITDAYDNHEDEINRIKDLTGLSFETIASAWAGNADAIAIVNQAYADMKNELRDTFGVSREAADATIRGWDGIMGPLTDTLQGYDDAKVKAQALQNQIDSMYEAEAQRIGKISELVLQQKSRFQNDPVKVPLVVDDSALRNYRVPFKVPIPTYFQSPSSRQLLP